MIRNNKISFRMLDINDVMLAFGSGWLLILSFPKFGTGLRAWVSLTPLFYALGGGKTFRQGLFLGLITGLTAQVGIMYWITHVVVDYGYLPYPVGIAAMLLLAAYLSLYTGLFSAAVVYFRKQGMPLWMAAPLLWTCLEYAKSHLLTGFPWENLGYSQYLHLPLIQIADIAGVYGVTFFIVLINAMIYELLFVAGSKKMILAKILIGVGIFLMIYGYGIFRIQEIGRQMTTATTVAVRIVQGNIDQSVKWDPQYQRETIDIHTALSMSDKPSSKPELIVWPETAFPAFFQDVNDLHRTVVGFVNQSRSWLLFGSPTYDRQEKNITLFNSALLLSPEGTSMEKYSKVHLVPYGEYVPLRQFFPYINKLVEGIGDFGTGPGYRPLTFGPYRVGVLICYEGIFPGAARTYKRSGADFLVNLTNDAWFGRTSAPYQHLSMTAFRAVENRLDVVRAANTGISAFIDATGKMTSTSALFEKAFLDGKVHINKERTFYANQGDVFIYICFLILMIMSVVITLRRKSHD
ncbi:MAG: apolipoprotein N-acyltransferase [Thermodesulfobacteriota bacterium]|nr:apolipoprotein N-acyltransferase [Thermodesulfobacteriota bacterium]